MEFNDWKKTLLDKVVIHMQENPFIRYGQSVSILTYPIDTNVYNQLVGTKYDCFYINDNVDKYLEKFFELMSKPEK